MKKERKILRIVASQTQDAQAAKENLIKRYGQNSLEDAEIIVALGGDGFVLKTLHETMNSGKFVYGMNRGGTGFLMNEFQEEDLLQRIEKAIIGSIKPLEMRATTSEGKETYALAINEVALWRQSCQSARIQIRIDDRIMLEELSSDGVMVATPAGSTAYNLSAHGPILPLESPLLALTPVSPFRPRRWRGALLSDTAKIQFDILESVKRPVNAAADHSETRSVTRVIVCKAQNSEATLLFDSNHSWNERILQEQFLY